MMKFAYYPGCTLKSAAKELEMSALASAAALDIELEEIKEWQCCGGVYPLGKDEIATRLSSIRVLASARRMDMPLVTVCAACHHVVKRVNYDMQNDIEMRQKANRYLQTSKNFLVNDKPYEGEVAVYHLLEVLRDQVGFDTIASAAKQSLDKKNVASYYGCLLLRPSDVMQFDNAENPTILEDFVTALEGTPVIYSERNECCGAYVAVNDPTYPQKRTKKIIESAKTAGADIIMTACPLCKYNLEKHQNDLPVYYFSELLAEALGVSNQELVGGCV